MSSEKYIGWTFIGEKDKAVGHRLPRWCIVAAKSWSVNTAPGRGKIWPHSTAKRVTAGGHFSCCVHPAGAPNSTNARSTGSNAL
jgi:hypothetical protein